MTIRKKPKRVQVVDDQDLWDAASRIVDYVRRPEFKLPGLTSDVWQTPHFETLQVMLVEDAEGISLTSVCYSLRLNRGGVGLAPAILSGLASDVIADAALCADASLFLVRSIDVEKRLRQKFGSPIGEGRGRLVFGNEKIVVKVPVTPDGEIWNEIEAMSWRNDERFARCRLLALGVHCLMMERLDLDMEELPEWSQDFDCSQVGIDRRGRVKIYDFASDVLMATPNEEEAEPESACLSP